MNNYLMRQSGIIPDEALGLDINIIGCGAVGRNVAIQLAQMGFNSLKYIDNDRINEANVGLQGWNVLDLGKYKVEGLEIETRSILTDMGIEPDFTLCDRMYDPHMPGDIDADISFVCVDSMTARRQIFETSKAEINIDSRMSQWAYQTYAYTSDDKQSMEQYNAKLHSPEESHPERCTARAFYTGAILTASRAVMTAIHWIKGIPIPSVNIYDGMTNSSEGDFRHYLINPTPIQPLDQSEEETQSEEVAQPQ